MLQYFIDLLKENKGQCDNILLTLLIKIKIIFTILYYPF